MGLLALLYLIGGGNLFLAALLIVLDSFLPGQRDKKSLAGKISLNLLLVVFCLLLPFFAWRFWYVAPLKEAFLGTSPFALFFPNYFYMTAWIALPVLLVISARLKKIRSKEPKQERRIVFVNAALIAGMLISGVYFVYNKQTNLTVRMSYAIDREDWETVLTDAPKSLPSELSCYFTNIALCKTGELSGKMFHYAQVGPTGLLLGHKNGYFNRYCMGIVFYHLGVIAEAKHCAFEALVGNSNFKEPNVQTLKYLVITSIQQRNTSDFNKYIRFFEQSLFYRDWAKQQKQRMNSAQQDSSLPIPQLSQPAVFDDFFVNYKYPHSALMHLLDDDPHHKMAFEYLMAHYLLQRDFDAAKSCFDKYYAGFNYPEIPRHYEEFLVLYYHANKKAERNYPVNREAVERFEKFQLLAMAPSTEEIREVLKSRYGNTYWYYVTFPLSSNLKTSDYETKTIY
jgi:hypothetical protein